MSKFKVGDKVKIIGGSIFDLYGAEGTVERLSNNNTAYWVKIGARTEHYSFADIILNQKTMPTTLERLAELEKSGEEFMIVGGNIVYKFIQGKLVYDNLGNAFSLATINEILKFGIVESPWIPKEGEAFWFIDNRGEIYQTHNNGSKWAKELLEAGNYFRTKELAEAVGIAKILKEANHG